MPECHPVPAAAKFRPGQVIVKWRDSRAPGDALGREFGMELDRSYTQGSRRGIFIYRVGSPDAAIEVQMQATRAALTKLCADPRVSYAEPNFIGTID